MKWDIQEEKEVSSVTLPEAPIMIDWCQHSVSMTEASPVVAALVKPGNVYLWDTKSNACEALRGMCPGSLTCFRWNHGGQGTARLAAGTAEGTPPFAAVAAAPPPCCCVCCLQIPCAH